MSTSQASATPVQAQVIEKLTCAPCVCPEADSWYSHFVFASVLLGLVLFVIGYTLWRLCTFAKRSGRLPTQSAAGSVFASSSSSLGSRSAFATGKKSATASVYPANFFDSHA